MTGKSNSDQACSYKVCKKNKRCTYYAWSYAYKQSGKKDTHQRRGIVETTAFNLKKAGWSLAFALALALAAACLLAGITCRPVFAAETPAESAVSSARGTDSKDRKKAAAKDGAAKDADTDDGKKETGKEKDADKLVPFDQAIESFYSDYDAMSDRAILQSAKNIASDGDVLLSKLDENSSNDVMAAMDAFEEAKVDYIMAQINGSQSSDDSKTGQENEADEPDSLEMSERDGICREWDKQTDYTRLMITEDSVIREMIPRYQITSCNLEDDVLKLAIDEWMTQGYGDAEGKGPENASSYIYNYSVSLKRGAEGKWTPFEINGTEVNFFWLNHQEVDPDVQTDKAPDALYPVKSDASAAVMSYAQIVSDGSSAEETGGEMDAEKADKASVAFEVSKDAVALPYKTAQAADNAFAAGAQMQNTSGLTTAYYDGYNADKAIAYANKYWKHYNHDYHDYRNEGGDCCNFVSQCLYAGGLPWTSTWFPNSVAWINVPATRRYLGQYGAMITADNTSVRRGNPVYYDWQGDGIYDHTALCVGTNSSGMPVVNAHTTNVYHAPWRLGSGGSRQTLLLNKKWKKSTPAYKKNSWFTEDGKVYYVDGNGNIVKNTFKTIGGARYFFGRTGARVTGFFKVNGSWYYASVKTGQMLKGWQYIGGRVFYFSKSSYKRKSQGRHKIGGYYYYFNKNGARQKGFITTGGKTYYASTKTARLAAGWRKISGKWYYFSRSNNVMAKGWKTINGRKCYFNSKGVLKKGTPR